MSWRGHWYKQPHKRQLIPSPNPKLNNMANPQNAPPCCTVDPYDHLELVRNSDATIKIPHAPAPSDQDGSGPLIIKDVQLNPHLGTWLRLYLPRQPLVTFSSSGKLPVVFYYHGSGFIISSAASALTHDFCSEMAVHLPAAVVSIEYRLAPEHRLPAAYEDAVEALRWLKRFDDEWVCEFADVSNCFLMGSSAGANMAYHAGLRAASTNGDLEPVKIRGLILHHPFFGGSKRTGSEMRLVNDPILPLSVTDLMWELSLPIGVDRDHEYCNPTAGKGRGQLDEIKRLGWRVLVTGCDGDPLVDRQKEAAEMMEGEGVEVVAHFVEGDHHGIELMVPDKAKALFGILKNFIKQPSRFGLHFPPKKK
ncbi:carboxylesterase 1-like [Malania oleifera]|uniref:carboxylesterase 1-like n=1 Tax=Malania oleifera TaxID=397392 RepID=UPI0025ADDAD0|nr:carboxylesterase 1-like [Malania oleifera]